ncbi:MAG TPA: phage tail protein [Pedococcus sp.]|jgi:phage tail-like protein|nr:phage tail protein [Pedococcus sp.]
MPSQPDPLEGSNFSVDLGDGAAHTFSRVELPVAVLDEVAYRSGADKSAEPRKQPGRASYTHLVLSRGLTSNLDLWEWWRAGRNGDPGVDRDVTVRLLDAAQQPVLSWRFHNAFPVVYQLSPLDTSSGDVVVETVELAFDSMDAEV